MDPKYGPQGAKQALQDVKAFVVHISSKQQIKCDSDEIGAVNEAIQTGQPTKLRQGQFNPSFWIATVEDEDRVTVFKKQVYDILSYNEQSFEYHAGNRGYKNFPVWQKLPDIFAGVALKRGQIVAKSTPSLPTNYPDN